jgi:hypothetical protein
MDINDMLMERLSDQIDTEREDAREGARRLREEWDEPIVPKMMGSEYEKYFYMDDHGNDIRDLAAVAEAQRDAEREREDEERWKHYWDAQHGN